MYILWYSGGFPFHSEVPRTIAHLWILDLDGTRIVMAAGTTPDNTPAETTEVLDIARSVHFLPPGAPASP
jgi:hypothetical protein